ncbi:MAG: hypothetical protein QOI34_90 [Verrucomicrobiota bacterium]
MRGNATVESTLRSSEEPPSGALQPTGITSVSVSACHLPLTLPSACRPLSIVGTRNFANLVKIGTKSLEGRARLVPLLVPLLRFGLLLSANHRSLLSLVLHPNAEMFGGFSVALSVFLIVLD